jgi:hypothetical protein
LPKLKVASFDETVELISIPQKPVSQELFLSLMAQANKYESSSLMTG